ncbi:hypothetical protein [Tannerella forsythia]|nr:hypothetical protein [Tannerella forsythia]
MYSHAYIFLHSTMVFMIELPVYGCFLAIRIRQEEKAMKGMWSSTNP